MVRIRPSSAFLRLLNYISTNTISQGVNFPIKNIIFHKVQIGGRDDNIQCRDFWNIVGRAGRAGKETEGKIIFVIKTDNDRKQYLKFINKNNIEPAESLIYKVLHSRLSQNAFSDYMSILSETYLLDLLSEEIIGTDYEDIIEKIIGNSLFKIQIDKHGLNVEPIRQEFRRIFKSFEDDNTTMEQLASYKKTGLSLRSNKIMDDFIVEKLLDLQNFLNEDAYLKITEYFIIFLTENDISEMENYKLARLELSLIDCLPVIAGWLSCASLTEFFEIWKAKTKLDMQRLHVFISNALYYLYPWGISSFLIILSYRMSLEYKDLPENIKIFHLTLNMD